MRNFRITVNGLAYDVSVEELGAAPVTRPAPQHKVPPKPTIPIASPPKEATVASPRPAAIGGNAVLAPMPGVVLNIMVETSQTVNCGDVLLILEAMKMENEVTAPADGIIKEIAVIKGASVSAGDLMVVIQ